MKKITPQMHGTSRKEAPPWYSSVELNKRRLPGRSWGFVCSGWLCGRVPVLMEPWWIDSGWAKFLLCCALPVIDTAFFVRERNWIHPRDFWESGVVESGGYPRQPKFSCPDILPRGSFCQTHWTHGTWLSTSAAVPQAPSFLSLPLWHCPRIPNR